MSEQTQDQTTVLQDIRSGRQQPDRVRLIG